MPRRRSGTTKRRRPRKRGMKRSMKTNYKVPLALKQHQFCERANAEQITIGNVSGTLAAPYYTRIFKFKDLKQCDQYSSIFDQYRLDKVIATFRYKGIAVPALQSAGAAGTGFVNDLNLMIYFKVDHNDVQANTLNVMKLSSKTRTHMLT